MKPTMGRWTGYRSADATTVTDVPPFDVTTLVDQTPLGFGTPSEHPAVWDVPARPEA